MTADDLGPWEPLVPAKVAALFARMTAPWWIGGGHAIELFLSRTSRSHADVDVLLLRRDQHEAHRFLPGWDIQAADPPGTLRPWAAEETLPTDVHDIWCRERPGGPWRLQFMLDEVDGDEWVSRRDDRIRRPVSSIGLRTADGLPIISPEIQLFSKAAFARRTRRTSTPCSPTSTPPHVDGLDDALALTESDHPWRKAIAEAQEEPGQS